MARGADPAASQAAAQRVSAWLQRRLRARNWNTAALARELGMNDSPVGRWVRGVQPPSSANAIRLADIFGDDPDYVLGLAGHRPMDDLDPEEGLSPEAKRIIQLVRGITWTDERFEQMESVLSGWEKRDRERRGAGA